ncbi:T9SS type B sorting domain-containing protein [Flavobacterium sp. GT2N3]|uniref:Ig-like domain-containing protein n=1 Tax=unclassified Flavobacterium TaxID=196869 RepID=UPI003AAF48B8
MGKHVFFKIILVLIFFTSNVNYATNFDYSTKKNISSKTRNTLNFFDKKRAKKSVANTAPVLNAQNNNQPYCPGSFLNIVSDMSITDTENAITSIYIQISSGYVNGEDLLSLAGIHPSITSGWDGLSGKFTLTGSTGQPSTAAFIAAIKDITYSSSNTSPSGIRSFSITIGKANYLARNGHYYEYISNPGISWTAAKAAAENSTYFGLQGYLATITAQDEAQLCGAQANGNGWIGGSDAETEGLWKWVTGPDIDRVVFWNGGANGTSPTYSNWNNGEPNNSNGVEHYAHVKAPDVPGTPGSWNDLQLNGDATGNYQAKGYIVEYGGMPGELPLLISTSTTIRIPKITNTSPLERCDSGSVMLKATASDGTVNWFDTATGGNLLATGNSYSTPNLSTTTTYYVDAGANCSAPRTAITATINTIPTITATNSPVSTCGAGTVTLEATASTGNVNWYSSLTDSTIIGNGTSLTVPNVTQNTTYYAEAINNGCTNGNRILVEVNIYTPPVVMDQEVTLCKSSTLILDAQIPNMTYLWSTGETTATITVATTGIYTVDVKSPAPENCTSRKKITVVEHDSPKIDSIDVNATTVVIYLKKSEDYFEYSVDGINYQSSNVFFNVSSGLQTASVREINHCGADSKTFVVLIAPKFFTPNNDSYNDVWEIKGLINYPGAEVTIFDRYGKLIINLSATNQSWDGTFNKNLLPADDYWYALKIDDTSLVKKGHFSLKR